MQFSKSTHLNRRIFPAALVSALLLVCIFWRSAPETPDHALRLKAKFLPSDWAIDQRLYPHNNADIGAHREAVKAAQRLGSLAKSNSRAVPVWEPLGPSNVGGRISALAFDPISPSVIYAGAATGGVFKSFDAGVSWRPVFDEQGVLSIGAVAVDPQNPNTIFAGTGEANGGHNNFIGGGVYVSRNGGIDWTYSGLEETISIARIAVDPANSNRVYVAAIGAYFRPSPDRGLYRSEDGGATWENVFFLDDSTGCIDLLVHPQNADTLLVAAWTRVRRTQTAATFTSSTGGIYQSDDGGDSWRKLGANEGLPAAGFSPGRIGLTRSSGVPDALYALYTDGFNIHSLYSSRDGGRNWRRTDPLNSLYSADNNFSWYFGQVRAHPQNPDTVFVLDVFLGRSGDGGETWEFANTDFSKFDPDFHVDHHALAFQPGNSDYAVLGNDGGIYHSSDRGDSWIKAPNLPVSQFYNIAIDPFEPERLYGGTQDNGTITTQSGQGDDWFRILDGDGFYVLIDPQDTYTIYAESQFGNLFRSTDRGLTWQGATNGIPPIDVEPRDWATPIAMNPKNSFSLLYGTNRVYKTTDQGRNWAAISPRLADFPGSSRLGKITTINYAPSDTNVIYAGTDISKVWRTLDGGEVWIDVSDGLPNRWVTRIIVHPENPDKVYVSFSGLKWQEAQPHVFMSENAGVSWQDISGNLPDAPVNVLFLQTGPMERLFAGTDVGAFVTEAQDGNWQLAGVGMPAVSVYDFAWDATNQALIAGTFGRSMYRLPLAPTTGVADLSANSVRLALQLQSANPGQAEAKLLVRSLAGSHISHAIYDVRGRVIWTGQQRRMDNNAVLLKWAGYDQLGLRATAGVYFWRITVGDQVRVVKLTRI